MGKTKGINYEFLEGDGTPVVFVHPWLGSIESWENVREKLDLDNPILFYDQRCHGESKCTEFSMDDLADDLKMLITFHGLEDPVIVGYSLGGMAAVNYAARYSNFNSLVLLGASASTPEPENERFSYFLEKLGELDRSVWAEKISENYAGHLEDRELKRESKRELVEAGENVLKYSLEAMQCFDVRNKIKSFNKPALVVAGDKDGAITVEKSRELAELLDADLEIIDSGHLMLWERPEKVVDLISGFLDVQG